MDRVPREKHPVGNSGRCRMEKGLGVGASLTLSLSLSALAASLLMASVLSFLRTKLKERRDDGEMLTETAHREDFRRVPRAPQTVLGS